jgi:hypothetical protein
MHRNPPWSVPETVETYRFRFAAIARAISRVASAI